MDLDDFAAGLTNIDVTRVVSTVVPNNLLRQQELDKCQDPDENTLPCDHTYKYRTYNGWCNNLNSPQYGKSVTSLVRFLSAKYDDGKTALAMTQWVIFLDISISNIYIECFTYASTPMAEV